MQFAELVSPTIKDLFVDKIQEMILSGKISVGEKLPTERELADQMNMSKTVVHSGICEMEQAGFLEVIPRRGTFVADYTHNGTFDTLTAIMKYNGGRLEPKHTKSILEVRLALEIPAIETLAKRHTDEDIAKLRSIVKEVEELVKNPKDVDYEEIAKRHYKFHHQICVSSGNTISPLVFSAFKLPNLAIWENSTRMNGPQDSVQRLEKLLSFIELHDSRQAVEFLRILIMSYPVTN